MGSAAPIVDSSVVSTVVVDVLSAWTNVLLPCPTRVESRNRIAVSMFISLPLSELRRSQGNKGRAIRPWNSSTHRFLTGRRYTPCSGHALQASPTGPFPRHTSELQRRSPGETIARFALRSPSPIPSLSVPSPERDLPVWYGAARSNVNMRWSVRRVGVNVVGATALWVVERVRART